MSDESGRSSSAYYRDRAIVQKIFREGTGLVVEKMDVRQLHKRLYLQAAVLERHVRNSGTADVQLARAAVEIVQVADEIALRGVQGTLFD